MTSSDSFYSLYTAIKPITAYIEANEKRIYSIITDIEEDESVSDEQWAVIEEIRFALLNPKDKWVFCTNEINEHESDIKYETDGKTYPIIEELGDLRNVEIPTWCRLPMVVE